MCDTNGSLMSNNYEDAAVLLDQLYLDILPFF